MNIPCEEAMNVCIVFFFFFQAEDGIRDVAVTGVQTCALPICFSTVQQASEAFDAINADYERHCRAARKLAETYFDAKQVVAKILSHALMDDEIGRASCRERV